MKKNGKATERRVSVVKCGETPLGLGLVLRRGRIVGGGGGACENLVGLSMCDDPIETVKYIWVNTSCMLDWILSQKL